MNNNKKKQEQLGMPSGTANARLRKMILFHLLKQLKQNFCYQCDLEIQDINELSIEHKKPWLDNSVELFWDLENIAFSHLMCNISAARRVNKIEEIEGKKWCWKCKIYKDVNCFPDSAKQGRECTDCYTKYRSEYRKRTGRR